MRDHFGTGKRSEHRAANGVRLGNERLLFRRGLGLGPLCPNRYPVAAPPPATLGAGAAKEDRWAAGMTCRWVGALAIGKPRRESVGRGPQAISGGPWNTPRDQKKGATRRLSARGPIRTRWGRHESV